MEYLYFCVGLEYIHSKSSSRSISFYFTCPPKKVLKFSLLEELVLLVFSFGVFSGFWGFFLGEGDGWVFGQGELSNELQPVVLFSLSLSKVLVDAVAFCASCPLT